MNENTETVRAQSYCSLCYPQPDPVPFGFAMICHQCALQLMRDMMRPPDIENTDIHSHLCACGNISIHQCDCADQHVMELCEVCHED